MEQAWLLDMQTSQAVRIDREVFRLGREKGIVEHWVDEDTVSRCHCEILRKDGNYFLKDLNSTNCTFAGELRVAGYNERELKNGDIIRIAEYRFLFLLREGEVW